MKNYTFIIKITKPDAKNKISFYFDKFSYFYVVSGSDQNLCTPYKCVTDTTSDGQKA